MNGSSRNTISTKIVEKISAILLLLLVLLSAAPHPASAHPHIWVDNTVTFMFFDGGLHGISMNWSFDEMFSSMIVHDHDSNGDGELSEGELADFRKKILPALQKEHFMTWLAVNGKNVPIRTVESLDIDYYGYRLEMNLTIPIDIEAGSSATEVRIDTHDREYYTNMEFTEDDPVWIMNDDDDLVIHYDIVDNPSRTYYYGQVTPREIVLSFSRK